jgi:RNA polymerase sigma factor (sigma-70 family)
VWQTQAPPANQLAAAHITAYLQEVCYWVAQRITTNFASQQSVADLFQTAMAKIHRILQGFNPQYSQNLKGYAEFVFSNLVKESLRQSQEVDICTDWGLLHKLTQKRLMEALQNTGLGEKENAAYVLAWKCFKELYTPDPTRKTRKLSKPDLVTWQAIAQLYNSQRLTQLAAPSAEIQPETLEKWLLASAKAVRNLLYPKPIAPSVDQEMGDLIDNLPDVQQESLLTEAIRQEEATLRQSQQQQLTELLTATIATLDPEAQALLQAYYGEEQTQQQIAKQLGIQQFHVSRRLTRLRKTLLTALGQWAKESLHVSPTSDVIEGMSAVLEEWLTTHYRHSTLP